MLGGCGGGNAGPTLYQLSGTVTFAGKPVPAGTILFEPDVAKGNRGPAGFATIRDGKFDTREGGKGTVGGPHTARITGMEAPLPEGVPVEEARVKSLFSEYAAPVDLPKEDATHDFEVPAKR
jgi:hypothetical protein